jgi:hypothetical protein
MLRPNMPLGVLVDNTIFDIAVTHEGKWISHSHGGYVARVPVYGRSNTTERHRQASYLTGLAHLAQIGSVSLHQSAELEDEQFRQPSGRYRGYGYCDYSLFQGLKIESIDGWVFSAMGPNWMNIPSAQDQQRERLRQSDDQLFHDLYGLLQQQLGKKCSQDAWHNFSLGSPRSRSIFFISDHSPSFGSLRSILRMPLGSTRLSHCSPVASSTSQSRKSG